MWRYHACSYFDVDLQSRAAELLHDRKHPEGQVDILSDPVLHQLKLACGRVGQGGQGGEGSGAWGSGAWRNIPRIAYRAVMRCRKTRSMG